MMFIKSVWYGFKMTSMAVFMLVLVWMFCLGFGVSYELLAGHTPEICKIGGQHGTE